MLANAILGIALGTGLVGRHHRRLLFRRRDRCFQPARKGFRHWSEEQREGEQESLEAPQPSPPCTKISHGSVYTR